MSQTGLAPCITSNRGERKRVRACSVSVSVEHLIPVACGLIPSLPSWPNAARCSARANSQASHRASDHSRPRLYGNAWTAATSTQHPAIMSHWIGLRFKHPNVSSFSETSQFALPRFSDGGWRIDNFRRRLQTGATLTCCCKGKTPNASDDSCSRKLHARFALHVL